MFGFNLNIFSRRQSSSSTSTEKDLILKMAQFSFARNIFLIEPALYLR